MILLVMEPAIKERKTGCSIHNLHRDTEMQKPGPVKQSCPVMTLDFGLLRHITRWKNKNGKINKNATAESLSFAHFNWNMNNLSEFDLKINQSINEILRKSLGTADVIRTILKCFSSFDESKSEGNTMHQYCF